VPASPTTPVSKNASTKIWLILLALIVAETLAAFETASAAQLIYAPEALFGGIDLPTLSWIITAFMLSGAVSVAFAGRLGDQFGRRRILLIVIGFSIVGSLISAAAPNIAILIAGRALQGISASILPLGLGIVREALPTSRHGLGIAIVSTTALIAGALGMLASGIILDVGNWELIFWISATMGILSAVLVNLFVPSSQSDSLARDNRVDYLGGILFGVGISLVLYGVTIADARGWTSTTVLSYLIAGLFGLLLWIWRERSIDYPMINLSRFKNKKFAAGMIATGLLALGPIGMLNVFVTAISRTDGTLHDQAVGVGLSASVTGIIGAVGAGITFVCSPIIGKIATKWGAKTSLIIGCFIEIVGLGFIVLGPTSTILVLLGICVATIGTGFMYSGMPTIIAESVPDKEVSAATGLNAVIRTTFQGVAATAVAILMSINAVYLDGSAVMSGQGLNWTIGVMIAVVITAIIILIRIPGSGVKNEAAQKTAQTVL